MAAMEAFYDLINGLESSHHLQGSEAQSAKPEIWWPKRFDLFTSVSPSKIVCKHNNACIGSHSS